MQALKAPIQNALKRVGLYHRIQASIFYDLYWGVADRTLVDNRRKEIDFYRGLLTGFGDGDLIFDVGANYGSKTAVFLSLGARVIAVEPDPSNQAMLREKFLEYRLAPKPVVIVGKALSDRCSVETMWVDEPGSATNTLSPKWVEALRTDDHRFGHTMNYAESREIETTTLEDLITLHGVPFFVKIDVEGYEIKVLQGLRRPVPYLSFEVNLPEFRPEGLQCVQLLGGLDPKGKFNYSTDLRAGLAFEEWLDHREFYAVLQHCAEPSIEVFWKTVA